MSNMIEDRRARMDSPISEQRGRALVDRQYAGLPNGTGPERNLKVSPDPDHKSQVVIQAETTGEQAALAKHKKTSGVASYLPVPDDSNMVAEVNIKPKGKRNKRGENVRGVIDSLGQQGFEIKMDSKIKREMYPLRRRG
ncbi:hypothetical protein A2773_05380 [Candidatus Gottesmanbacteria bacterium RIFCSPHIGHO2_01_FULL_39_10]|uniref:Uncharacterized protein n=1 Tax=Candidatus Gottesmanbacteria bacterium RIFCSPHIGHO2_01_FULL_39_10 TaxID=1798375 RepID=A0A1F5ZP48_9BACT|nr:MAG: hypothetical protein A2773_05380 [Candidatus Gottesmanbacteria bacterium RIFCSPHIGHO2_01_FULL_39_10]